MWNIIIYRIKKFLKGSYKYENGKYDKVNALYEKAHKNLKGANSYYRLIKVRKDLIKLDDLVANEFNNLQWLRNRNQTLKMLWLIKFNRYIHRGKNG